MEVYKLGKHPKKEDDRNLKLSKYLDHAVLDPAPESIKYASAINDFGMMLNDKIGNCTCAANGHRIQVLTQMNGSMLTVSDESVEKMYEDISGYNPATGANDNGANMLDVMKYMQSIGLDGHKTGPYLEIDIKNLQEVKQAIYIFGSVNIGIQLAISMQGALTWDVADPSLQGDSAPGSWGGHDVIVPGYNVDSLWPITWGAWMELTNRGWLAYVDEAYVQMDPLWLNPFQQAPNGFDLAQLQSDYNALI